MGPEREGGRGRGARSEQPAVPVFVAAERPVAEWLKPVADRPGTFRTDGVGRTIDDRRPALDVNLVPFYRLHRRDLCHLLGPVHPGRSGSRRRPQYAAEQERQRKLEAATVAFAQPGEMQPERDFNFQAGERRLRPAGPGTDRPAGATSWFSFDLPVDAGASDGARS